MASRKRCNLSLFLVVCLVAILSSTAAEGFGSMSTLAPMWGTYIDRDDKSVANTYSMCLLEAGRLVPKCLGNIQVPVPPANISFLALSAGAQFTCGLVYKSQVPVCWGDPVASVPNKYKNVSYSTIASGAYHVCALHSGSGSIDCWGQNLYGESRPPRGGPFTSLTSGWDFTCALSNLDQRAVCWGKLDNESLHSNLADPHAVFDSIYAGRSYVCGIEKGTGSTKCWGSDGYSQASPPPYTRFKSIAPSMFHTCGLLKDESTAACWGDNYYNQLNNTPTGVAFTTLASGDFYTCGVSLQKTLHCWGNAPSAAGDFARIKVAPTFCTKNCGRNQTQLTDVCPAMDEAACIDCTPKSCKEMASRKKSSKVTIIVLTVVPASLIVAVAAVLTHIRRKSASKTPETVVDLDFIEWENQAKRVRAFSLAELQLATNSFNSDMVIGKGAFGMVYRATLSDGKTVAIKKSNLEKTHSFGGELKLLSRIHHANLVNLVGYCKEEILLVFEYMANGSLYDCLFTKNIKLDWFTRLKIATQAAHGLEYLHLFADPTIIHRDVKSSNILLDEEFNAHVSDFGVSTLGPADDVTHITSTSLVGTPGYLDPEYFQTMQLSPNSDVYSFGVVLLELFTGRKAVDLKQSTIGVVSYVMKLAEGSCLIEALDKAKPVDGEGLEVLLQMLKLALSCVQPKARDRPAMSSVAHSLEKAMKAFGAATSRMEWPASSSCTDSTSGPSTVERTSTVEASFSSSMLAEFQEVSPK